MCYTADFSHSCCHASTYDEEIARLESKRDIVHEKKIRIRGGHGVIGRNVESIPEHMYFFFGKMKLWTQSSIEHMILRAPRTC